MVFIGAIGALSFSIGVPACVPLLVERNQLLDANRWIELGRSVAFVAGPVVGGAFVAFLGADKTFVVVTMACLAALALLLKLDVRRGEQPGQPRVKRSPGEGIQFVFTSPILRPIFVASMVFNVGWFILQAVFVVYATNELKLSPTGIGFAMGAYGVGMVLGAFIAPVLSKLLTIGALAALGPISGLVAASAGTHWCLIASTVAFLAQCAMVFRSQLPGVRELLATSENYYAVR